MNEFFAWIVMLAQLSGFASIICQFPIEDFETHSVPIVQRELEDFAPTPDGADVSVAGIIPNPLEITCWRVDGNQRLASIPPRPGLSLAPWILAASDGWWFSSMGTEDSGTSVYFVRGKQDAFPSIIRFPYVVEAWLPVRSSTPRGLALSWREEESQLSVEEVTPEGHKEIAAFPWQGRSYEEGGLYDRIWSAEALSSGQYALIGVEVAGDKPLLAIRIIDTKQDSAQQISEQTIRCAVGVSPIATALDSRGNLAIVALAPDDSIIATIVDPTNPTGSKCKTIAPPGEFEGMPPLGSPAVRSTRGGFVAAWIRHDGAVRTTALDSGELAGPIVNVGSDADVRAPLRQMLHPDAEGVTFIWKDVSGALKSRRLPLELRSFAILTEFRRLFCVDPSR